MAQHTLTYGIFMDIVSSFLFPSHEFWGLNSSLGLCNHFTDLLVLLHQHSVSLSTVLQGGYVDTSTDFFFYFLINKTDNNITWRIL